MNTYILYWHWEKMAIPRLLIFFMLVNDGKEVRSISSTMFMNVQERPTVMHMQWMHIRTLCDTIWYTYSFFFFAGQECTVQSGQPTVLAEDNNQIQRGSCCTSWTKGKRGLLLARFFYFFLLHLNLLLSFLPNSYHTLCSLQFVVRYVEASQAKPRAWQRKAIAGNCGKSHPGKH